MKKVSVIAIVTFAFLSACSSGKKLDVSAHDYYNNFKSEIRKHEWTSFDINITRLDRKEHVVYRIPYHIVVKNSTDTPQNSIAVFTPDHSILLKSDSITYINDLFAEIATMGKKCANNGYNLFEMLAYETINLIEHFESFSPIMEKFSHAYISDESSYLKERKGYYEIKGFVTGKYCTTEECHLVEIPASYFFNAHTGILDSVVEKSNPYKTAGRITNISHTNNQNLIDSIFDIHADKYKNYSVQINDTLGIYSRSSLSNKNMTETVLNYPLINANTGDTATLKDFKGWTLLCLLESFNGTKQRIETVETNNFPFENIIYLMPYSDNLVYIKPWADSLNTHNKIFYTKKISRALSMANSFYLISPEKETVFYAPYFVGDTLFLKAKADYEKRHNLKP